MTALPSEVIRLWPEGPPSTLEGFGPEVTFRGSVGTAGDAAMLRNVSEPTLTAFLPTNGKSNGVGVIVCPGGGWSILAWEHEGVDVARWLAAHGYTAFRHFGSNANGDGFGRGGGGEPSQPGWSPVACDMALMSS
jgi:hypothetical protein